MYIDIDGIKIYYEEENANCDQVAFVVHGWGASIAAMKPVINSLKHKYRVIAMALPGHDKSDQPKDVIGTSDYADIILKFMDQLNLTNIFYFGHSYGGKCGIEIASRPSHPIKKLVLIDASGIKAPLDFKSKFRIRYFKFMKKLYVLFKGEKNLEKFYKKHGSADYKSADGVMRKILVRVVNEDLTEKLENINVPTLAVWGKNDMDTPLWMGQMMEEKIPSCKLEVLDGGHYSYLDDIIRFRNVVEPFLED